VVDLGDPLGKRLAVVTVLDPVAHGRGLTDYRLGMAA